MFVQSIPKVSSFQSRRNDQNMNTQSTPTADMKLAAVLIDTVSIQPYVFGSNKLRENIGASYLVGDVLYKQVLPSVLGVAPDASEFTAWHRETTTIAMLNPNPPEWEIAYEGGGNALVLFRDHVAAKAFVKAFSKAVLLNFPGMRVAMGLVEDIGQEELKSAFGSLRARLEDALGKAKHLGHTSNVFSKSGIVEDCPRSNEAATVEGEKGIWIGLGTQVKEAAAAKAQNHARTQYPAFAGTRFAFTEELELFGQPEDKGYVAIVHIDGNGIGERFQQCASLPELRNLSILVSNVAQEAMKETIDHLVALLPEKSPLREEFDLEMEDGKHFLPLRPLLIGGDDVVYVCEGRLGIYTAQRYIESFCNKMNKDTTKQPVAACAGVAIVKTKYPFYRAYEWAEELMRKAKEKSRGNNYSWLAFLVSASGFNGELEDILAEQYQIGEDQLYGGPYSLKGGPNPIGDLLKGIHHFAAQWPRNKVMDLRDVLVKSKSERDYFMVTLKSRNLELPDEPIDIKSPPLGKYMDMIELLPFHLKALPL